MAKIVAVSNQKGGVGKTTTCVSLACAIAKLGYRVLVVDFDAQANASSCFGLYDKKASNTMFDVLCNDIDISTCVRSCFGVDIIPSCEDLAGAELELAKIVIGREKVLSEKLQPFAKRYDYVFVDCPPTLNLLTVNALTCADSVIIPIQCEYFALEGLHQMMNTIKLVRKFLNANLDICGVVLTMFDKRAKLSKDVATQVEQLFGNKVFKTTIPRNIRLAEAPSFGKPILHYDKNCAGALAYSNLAQEFIQQTKE